MKRRSHGRRARMLRAFSGARRQSRPAGGALLGLLLVTSVTGAAPDAQDPKPSPPEPALSPPADPMQRIGSISVGHPHGGYLINGVRMPLGDQWLLSIPDHSWGTDETIAALIHCIGRVNELIPNTPRVIIGSISAQGGGRLPPHKSHRTGRDVDVHLYLTKRAPKKWYEPATSENLDRARNWALLRAVITETDVEMVLLDQSVQDLLEAYALSAGEDPGWVKDIFHGTDGHGSIVKHVPGHTGHMHIRFFSPAAQRRGRDVYDQLIAQGHIVPQVREVVHEVVAGDALLRLARHYGATVEEIQRLNGLDGTVIKVGQKLKISERVDVRGARAPVVIPARRLPPTPPSPASSVTRP